MRRVRRVMRMRHVSRRTEVSDTGWIVRFVRFHGLRHPREMGAREVEAFLSHLAVDRKVSASTQNQALCAILFLYRRVLRWSWSGWGTWFGWRGLDSCRWF